MKPYQFFYCMRLLQIFLTLAAHTVKESDYFSHGLRPNNDALP